MKFGDISLFQKLMIHREQDLKKKWIIDPIVSSLSLGVYSASFRNDFDFYPKCTQHVSLQWWAFKSYSNAIGTKYLK